MTINSMGEPHPQLQGALDAGYLVPQTIHDRALRLHEELLKLEEEKLSMDQRRREHEAWMRRWIAYLFGPAMEALWIMHREAAEHDLRERGLAIVGQWSGYRPAQWPPEHPEVLVLRGEIVAFFDWDHGRWSVPVKGYEPDGLI